MAGKGNKGADSFAGLLLLLLLLGLAGLGRGRAEEILTQAAFVQMTNSTDLSEYMFDFDGDEIFHVDLQQRSTVWRLPEFGEFASFQAEGAQGNIAILNFNLNVLMKRTNHTPAENKPPDVMLYTQKAVELGVPNILICVAEDFSPPVVKMSWLKNGEPVTEGVQSTDYYPKKDHAFRRFSYLLFVPSREDDYACRVEHWGLEQPLQKEWNANIPELPETAENVACGLGLAVGIAGIIGGTILLAKSRKMSEALYRRGNL